MRNPLRIRVTACRRPLLAGLIVLAPLIAGAPLAWASAIPPRAAPVAQVTETPVPLQFPTSTGTPPPPSASPTRTPTSLGRPAVEAISAETGTNVRAEPDINASIIGKIYPGTQYGIIGQRFEWYLIEFPDSPSGTGWVNQTVVNVSGDVTTIQELALEDIPTIDPAFLVAQQTAAVITQTPGAQATLTAQSQVTPTGVFTPNPSAVATLVPGAPLPTFTYPPFTYTPVIIPEAAPAVATSSSGIPPVVPILALAALGVMGLLIALLRRL
jgi:hypothetical protein